VATAFHVRRATVADADTIAHQRAEMFLAMGRLPRQMYDELVAATRKYLAEAMLAEEYLGWLGSPVDTPRVIVGGAGVVQRRVPPHPLDGRGDVRLARGRQGLVLNVYTEPAWRRRGVAELLMRHVLAWAADSGVETLVLHASNEGQPLYERLGFVATNEMRFTGACPSANRSLDR
jgi:GNAT superfamily N-acetyltransferase